MKKSSNAYHFQKNYGPAVEHIKRHFPTGQTRGSIFTGTRFRTVQDVIDYAYEIVKGRYRGEEMVIQKRFDEFIGLEGIVDMNTLPDHTSYKREMREKRKGSSGRPQSYTTWVAYGTKRKPTKNLVIIAGSWPSNPSVHTFLTIYPGMLAPDFDDQQFWNRYAFTEEKNLKSRKRKRR